MAKATAAKAAAAKQQWPYQRICRTCGVPHVHILYCPHFSTLATTQRINYANSLQSCLSCLSTNHPLTWNERNEWYKEMSFVPLSLFEFQPSWFICSCFQPHKIGHTVSSPSNRQVGYSSGCHSQTCFWSLIEMLA